MPCYAEQTGFTGAPRPTYRVVPPPSHAAGSPPVHRPAPRPATTVARGSAPIPPSTGVRPAPAPARGAGQPPQPPAQSAANRVTDGLRLGSALLGVPAELNRLGAGESERALASGWSRVAARPVNSQYAGQRFPLADRRPDLAAKYPDSVRIDAEGFPDFSPYARATVKLRELHPSASNSDTAGVSRSADFTSNA